MSYFLQRKTLAKQPAVTQIGNLRATLKSQQIYERPQRQRMEYSYEEYMCDQLSEYIRELHQFRHDISLLTQKLVIDLPFTRKHRKTRSQVPQKRRIEPLRRSPRFLHTSNGPRLDAQPKKILAQTSNKPICKYQYQERMKELGENSRSNRRQWVILDLPKSEKKRRPRSQYASSTFYFSPYRHNDLWLAECKEPLAKSPKKSPYEITPESIKNIRQRLLKIRKEKQQLQLSQNGIKARTKK